VKTELIPKLKLKKENADIENIDGEWFLKENLVDEDKIKKKLGIKEIGDLVAVQKALRKLTDKVKLKAKDKYYAIILFDGDNMGRWLSGELLPNLQYVYNSEIWGKLPDEFKKDLKEISKRINKGKRFLSPAIHATISHALRNYSIEFVRKIIEEEHLGKLVYSGGDDVLAFVSVYDLFEVMRKLRAAFSGHVRFENGNIKVDWSNESGFVEKDGMYLLTMGKNATASCGVAIAHYKMPLRMVLLKAQELRSWLDRLTLKSLFSLN
jgi:CRISPR-associated protein Cmr2